MGAAANFITKNNIPRPHPGRADDQNSFESKNYTSILGQRSYKLFVPSGHSRAPMPLVVMLHGCTQTPDDFATGTQMNELGEELGFFVAYPEQPRSANSNNCWNWFRRGDQQRDQGEPALLAGITRQIIDEYSVDHRRVYAAGLSAGGAMAAVLGMAYPDQFAAIGVHSGLPYGAASNLVNALGVMKRGASRAVLASSPQVVPAIIFHGDRDLTVNPANADAVLDQFDITRTYAKTFTMSQKSTQTMGHSKLELTNENGLAMFEKWLVQDGGHAWSGGDAAGSYTEPRGPDASREMVRFFFQHSLAT